MENPLQHPQEEEFVQHLFHLLQILHMQYARGRQFVEPREQGQSAYQSDCMLSDTRKGEKHHYDFASEFVGII